MSATDLTGQRFGRLVVIERNGSDKYRGPLWLCQCDCGKTTTTAGSRLRAKMTASCGCYRLERALAVNTLHGRSHSGTYHTWDAMIQRCTNPHNRAWANYGGRGIKVHPSWLEFNNFLRDMGERPEGMTLDRIDNSASYGPQNCRWSSRKEQAQNRRNSLILTYQGQSLTLSQWSEKIGISRKTLDKRLVLGWSVEKTLSTPVKVG